MAGKGLIKVCGRKVLSPLACRLTKGAMIIPKNIFRFISMKQ